MSVLDRAGVSATFDGLFEGLFDDAALFPPGNASMDDAVRRFEQDRHSWYAGLVASFVCPAGRLAELAATAGNHGIAAIPVSVTVPDGMAGVTAALEVISEHPVLALHALEVPAGPDSDLALAAAAPMLSAGVTGYLEVPADLLTEPVATGLADAGLGLKLRTGGLTPVAFPPAETLAGALAVAVAAGLQVKCTAGLHHAVALTDPATGLNHFGFLNVLLAVAAVQAGGEDAAELLSSRDHDELGRRVRELDAQAVSALRAQFRSIGSCSIAEPLDDLRALGLVRAP